ncbi:MAG: porin [Pseudomonadales bacterium]
MTKAWPITLSDLGWLLAGILLLFCHVNTIQANEVSGFDKTWATATLYDEPEKTSFKSFKLTGRLQAEAASFHGDVSNYDDILWRRFRFGFKSDITQSLTVHLEAAFDLNNPDQYYSKLTDANIGWKIDRNWLLKMGKSSAGFTLDGATSSTKLLTLQRNNITNNLWYTQEYWTGLSLASKDIDGWSYKAGVFSSEDNEEFSHFNAGFFSLLSAQRSFQNRNPNIKTSLRLDYIYNNEDQNSDTAKFGQILTLAGKHEHENWGVWTDLSAGKGFDGQSDLWGLSAMPFYNTSPRTQLLARFTYMESQHANGIKSGRYEKELSEGKGDRYREYYAGFNVFFYGHKLKWQTGIQNSTMKDKANDGGGYDNSWGATTGIRIYW